VDQCGEAEVHARGAREPGRPRQELNKETAGFLMTEFLCAGQILCEPVYYITAYAPFVLFFVMPLYFYLKGSKKQSVLALLAFSLSLGLSMVFKQIFNVSRPFGIGSTPSFPSSHASLAFCEARFMNVNRVAFILGSLFAFFIGFGRVYAGFHTWQDILGGLVLGYSTAEIVIRCRSRVGFHRK